MARALRPQTDTAATAFERFGLSDEQLITILRNMLMQRIVDNRGFQLNRQGKVPFALGSEGHEAVQAGAALAFARGKDIFVPYYRDLGLVLGIGYPILDLLLSMFARGADRSGGRQFPNHFGNHELGIMNISSIISAHIPHAVGAAYAFTYRGETGRAVLVHVRRRRNERRRMARIDQLRIDSQLADRLSVPEQRHRDLGPADAADARQRRRAESRRVRHPG